MHRFIVFLLLGIMPNAVLASITIPSPPSSPSAYSEIRTSNGTTCRTPIGGNLQIYGGITTGKGEEYNHYSATDDRYHDVDETGGFVAFSYSLGGEKPVRCQRLAEIETERAELELKKLRHEIALLEKLTALKELDVSGALPSLSD